MFEKSVIAACILSLKATASTFCCNEKMWWKASSSDMTQSDLLATEVGTDQYSRIAGCESGSVWAVTRFSGNAGASISRVATNIS